MGLRAFSLVELMVVVAIMGVLAAIAIPNFRKYQARASQAEAKTSLSSLYIAMQNFKGEWQIYTGVWAPIDHRPAGSFSYEYGFKADFNEKFCGTAGMKVIDMTLGCGPKAERTYTGFTGGAGASLKSVRCGDGSTCTPPSWATTKWNGGDIKDFVTFEGDLRLANYLSASTPGNIDTKVTATEFVAGAVGDPLGLGASAAANIDAWSIDHNKKFNHNPGANVDL